MIDNYIIPEGLVLTFADLNYYQYKEGKWICLGINQEAVDRVKKLQEVGLNHLYDS